METLYLFSLEDEDVGEVQGIFNKNGELLGSWPSNDGNWRCEYFNGFMKKLGYTTTYAPKRMWDEMKKKLIAQYND